MSATDSATSHGPRVALLARPGVARDQLRAALLGAGAQIALEDDPNALDVEALLASQPQVVLVALEPSIEDALVRLDPVLGNPQLTVIYDEADLAASRQGWDVQRWSRHLGAKLHGHRDVLPPGAEIEQPQISQLDYPQRPAQVEDDALELHLHAAVPQHAALLDEPGFGTVLSSDDALDWQQPADAFSIDAEHWTPPPARAGLELIEGLDSMLASETTAVQAMEPVLTQAPAASAFSNLSLVENFEVVTPVRRTEPMMPPPLPPGFGGLTLELESLEEPEAGDNVVAEGSKVAGAVMLFAGIGGPDAVRRVLAGLPSSLVLPVLVHLRLDGGRHDNLAKQIQRISPMPVMLARAGTAAQAGHVYVVPDDVAADASNGGMVAFGEGQTDVLALFGALPPDRSAVLLLSGADAALAEPAMMLGARGALVSGQSLQGCYDWAASKALEHRGGTSASPEELALRLIDHLGG